ncbi:MAG: two-component regulator propeller domain-containing protein, partial [Arcobacteraceae bacterium]
GGGICKVDKSANQFAFLQNEIKNTNLPNEPIWSILKTNDDYLWVGFKGNENIYYSKEGVNYFKIKLPISSGNISTRKKGIKAMYEDLEGSIWIANNNNLFELQKEKNDFKITPIKILNNQTSKLEQLLKTTSIYQSSDGVFWIGTQQSGLRKSIEPGNPKNQLFETLLPNERITTFLEDKSRRIWIGSYRGLHIYEPSTNSFLTYSKKQGKHESLSSDIIICLYKDKHNNIWIGTPNGLNLAIPDEDQSYTFKSFQEKDGLPNNYIHSILEDDNGNLWISTNKGISKYNIKENSFYNYDVNDGLKSNSFMENTGLKDANGKFYFGGIYGLNIFHPDSIRNTNIPPVVLTELRISGQKIKTDEEYNNRLILNKSIEYNQEITLTHKENIFSIDYTALDFHSTSGYSYKIKMEGLDQEWHAATLQKNVTYSNLNAGDYTFKVKTISDKEDSDSSIASLKITILPSFWETWQAFVLYTLLFVALLYLYRYFITKQNTLKNKLDLSRLNR